MDFRTGAKDTGNDAGAVFVGVYLWEEPFCKAPGVSVNLPGEIHPPNDLKEGLRGCIAPLEPYAPVIERKLGLKSTHLSRAGVLVTNFLPLQHPWS